MSSSANEEASSSPVDGALSLDEGAFSRDEVDC